MASLFASPSIAGVVNVNAFGSLSRRSRAVFLALIVIVGAALFWGRSFVGPADGQAGRKEQTASTETESSGPKTADPQTVDLSEKQAATLKINPVGSHDFALLKTAVGTIDFNENLLVQVFSQYAGKILKANFNIGDDVKAGDVHDRQSRSSAGGINLAGDSRCARIAEAHPGARDQFVEGGR
jgi:cobalt-zinc-cadmium efflux system membrane fusion protein